MAAPRSYITITDDSINSAVGTSAIPLIIIATEENKKISEKSTEVYPGTAESGVLRLIAGQQDLISKYGAPQFTKENGIVMQGDERSEYGLWSAYSYLGASSLAYILRADIDLKQLQPVKEEPKNNVKNGTIWFDTTQTKYGVLRSNGNFNKLKSWEPVQTQIVPSYSLTVSNTPMESYGQNGDIAIVTVDNTNKALNSNKVYEKILGQWYQIGSDVWFRQYPTIVTGTPQLAELQEGSFYLNETQIELSSEDIQSIEKIAEKIKNYFIQNLKITHDDTSLTITHELGGNIHLSSNNIDYLGKLGLPTGIKKGVSVHYKTHTNIPEGTAGSIWVKTTKPNNGSEWIIKQYSASKEHWDQLNAPLYKDEIEAEAMLGDKVKSGVMFVDYPEEASCEYNIKKYTVSGGTTLKGTKTKTLDDVLVGTASIRTLKFGNIFTYNIDTNCSVREFLNKIQALKIEDFMVSLNTEGYIEIIRDNGGAYELLSNSKFWENYLGVSETIHSKWTKDFDYIASPYEPKAEAKDGTLWFSPEYKVDIMFNDGTKWVGYNNYKTTLDPNGPQVTSKEPLTQSNGSELVEGDVWVNPSVSEKYPLIYTWNADEKEWNLVDLTDQTTPSGIIFADARENAGYLKNFSEKSMDLAKSDFVDPDSPDPKAYPVGIMLFNTRYSTRNVKKYDSKYFATKFKGQETYNVGDSEEYAVPGSALNPKVSRWINASGNEQDGKPYMGRKAQRVMVTKALASTILTNQDVRAEDVEFNLLACPGYVECYDELISLAQDKKETCYIITDPPARLKADATAISEWVKNSNNAASNGEEGLCNRYTYSCACYGWGLGSDLEGNEVAIPSSAIKLRQIAVSDAMTNAVWKPAAGVRRGLVSNATSIGYIDDEGEYVPAKLQEGLRNVIFDNGLVPIYNVSGFGLTIWGDKNLTGVNSALNQEGTARMVCMIRSDLDKMVKPFYFELNTKSTRDSVKGLIEGYLQGIMAKDGLEDFAVVCDTSNNTQSRISNNELYIDVGIMPQFSTRFIFIPIRIVNDKSKL